MTSRSFAAALLAVLVASPAMAQADGLPRVEPVDDCFATPADGTEVPVEYDCGYVVVPEFHGREGGRQLKVPFMRFQAGQDTELAPVVVHPGGPGGSQLSENVFLLRGMFDEVNAERDVIFMDPRGTKHADTFLDCPARYSIPWQVYEQGLDDEAALALGAEVLQRCVEDFEAQGVDLDAYNSLELAADVDALREALGYERIIFYGASYGAQLGQHVMRDFPDMLEAVILDGSNALSRKSWIEDRALDVEFGITNLAERCRADARCDEAYPDVLGMVEEAFALVESETLDYRYTDPDDPTLTIEEDLSAADLAAFLYEYQGNPTNTFLIPFVLDKLLDVEQREDYVGSVGEVEARDIIEARDRTEGPTANLQHLAVVCSDDTVRSLDDIILDGVGTYSRTFAEEAGAGYVFGCPIVGVTELPDSTDEDVTVDIPTLILSGDLDVATPAFRSQVVADSLPDARHVVFPGHTHVQLGQINLCAKDVFTQFIADPSAELDTSCLADDQFFGFALPDGSFSLLPEEDAGG